MRELMASGHRCFTVDWTEHVVVGSHVVEHIAERRIVLEQLHRHLAPDGILFVEVSVEIWRRVPHMTEPVTHKNFFVPASLRALLEHAGYTLVRCATGSSRYGAAPPPVVRAIARNVPSSGHFVAPGGAYNEVLRYSRPTRWMRLRNRLFMPETWCGALRYQVWRRIQGGA